MIPGNAKQWVFLPLGDFATFRNGVNYNKGNFGKGIKVINVKDFQDYSIASYNELDEINPHGIVREESLLQDGDILFVRSNGNRDLIGRSLFISGISEPVTHSAFTIRARIASRLALPRFYAYLFRSSTFRRTLSARGSGTNISNLNQDLLSQYEVAVPPVETQRKIAAILSAYDDLIENNTRRIKILEEMAQALYREWFVHFRFPGHEKVKMVASPIGSVPKGWDVKPITDAVAVSPRTVVPKEGEKPFIPMTSLSNDSMLIDDIESRTGNGGSKFMNGDTLFARITPCLENGKTAFVQFLPSPERVAFGSTEFIVLRSKTLCPELVYLIARSNEFRDNAIKSMSGATGRQRVQEQCFNKFLFAHPDQQTVSTFSKVISPLFRNVYMIATKNKNLRRTRDLLLPKLISGEIDVSNLDTRT